MVSLSLSKIPFWTLNAQETRVLNLLKNSFPNGPCNLLLATFISLFATIVAAIPSSSFGPKATNVKDKRQGLAVTYGHGLLRRLPLLRVILSLSRFVDANGASLNIFEYKILVPHMTPEPVFVADKDLQCQLLYLPNAPSAPPADVRIKSTRKHSEYVLAANTAFTVAQLAWRTSGNVTWGPRPAATTRRKR
ncbi:hypothetical protein B0H14DRAFT_3552764 [Mycena olivaceomarginata]|nr:hypothetical protein B0H14DRAFT_3552764 [Mycena olivaceomarginata]